MENSNKILGNKIKTEREAQHIQQKDLAKMVGVAPSTIQRYEAGTFKVPKRPVIKSIAKCLNINPMWLLGESEDKYVEESSDKVIIFDEQHKKYVLTEAEVELLNKFRKFQNTNSDNKEYINHRISENISLYREDRGLSIKEFAEKLNVDEKQVVEWEAGHQQLTVDNVKNIATVLNLQISDIFKSQFVYFFQFSVDDLLSFYSVLNDSGQVMLRKYIIKLINEGYIK